MILNSELLKMCPQVLIFQWGPNFINILKAVFSELKEKLPLFMCIFKCILWTKKVK